MIINNEELWLDDFNKLKDTITNDVTELVNEAQVLKAMETPFLNMMKSMWSYPKCITNNVNIKPQQLKLIKRVE